MLEDFIAIFEDGPWPGSYDVPKVPADISVSNWPVPNEWPLPKFVKAKGERKGCYIKVWESQGKPKTGEARGARYQWNENSTGKEVSQ